MTGDARNWIAGVAGSAGPRGAPLNQLIRQHEVFAEELIGDTFADEVISPECLPQVRALGERLKADCVLLRHAIRTRDARGAAFWMLSLTETWMELCGQSHALFTDGAGGEGHPLLEMARSHSSQRHILAIGRPLGAQENRDQAEWRKRILSEFLVVFRRVHPSATLEQAWTAAKRHQNPDVRRAANRYKSLDSFRKSIPKGVWQAALEASS